ncbi:MAG: phenylacetate--CoA ligase family protein [Eubacteriales bacterium]|nr:phenylacetate--CoA ligase family protein [Eubacteriales bacterium]
MNRKMSMLGAISTCKSYPKMSPEKRESLRNERLKQIVKYARDNSPYYGRLYEGLPELITIKNLPVVTKQELMEHYDEWCTDRSISFKEVETFISDRNNLGRKFKGKYSVHTTSGSTGVPLILMSDAMQTNVMNAITLLRAIPSKEAMNDFVKNGGKSMEVYADNGFYLGNGSIHAKLKAFPWKKKQIGIADALLPTEKIVERLNEFQPVMLGGYPSSLELLIGEHRNGNLKIKPKLIMTGGEYLSTELRKEFGNEFGCPVFTTYACTEGGTIACECSHGHLHINDDWMYVEAVNSDNTPTPQGEFSDKLLLTNLSNYLQPVIRYEVTDRVRLHNEGCGCGNPSPWIEIEGRTDDIVRLLEDGREIKVAPLAVYACLKAVHEIRRFQVIVKEGNVLELRLIPFEGSSREDVFEKAREELIKFFKEHGVVHIQIELSSREPAALKNGKFKHVVSE